MLLRFRYRLDRASEGPILNLKNGVPVSPPLRSLFAREPEVPSSTMLRVQTKLGVKTDTMLWIFQTALDDRLLFLCGLLDLMDELGRLIQSDPKQKERLSASVARILSVLSVIVLAWHELNIYRPWAAGMDYELVEYDKDIKAESAKKVVILDKLDTGFKNLSLVKFWNAF
jgi:hypothetical protein